jgi:hypothetical protein
LIRQKGSIPLAPIRFGGSGQNSPKNPIEEIKMWAQHYHKYIPIWLALGISAVVAPTIAQAEVHVEGTLTAVHVTTDKDAIPDVLSAFETPFNLRYHTSVQLDGNVSSVYSGSLAHVISRLLGGYDYVITHDRGTIDIVVWGKRGQAAVQKSVTAPDLRAVTAQGAQVSDASMNAKTYSTCMALFRDAADCAEMMKRLNGSAR